MNAVCARERVPTTPPCGSPDGSPPRHRIAEIDTTIAELLALRKTLTERLQRADDCADDQPVTVCGIIEDS
ncbi:hypothetical protein ABZ498_01005 [Streptomyces lavendulocolor]|uniref:hypothetical protein n=1 Tax=Streptomyces lavendulocolor TaxID=67316 RepID=UPI0033F6989E